MEVHRREPLSLSSPASGLGLAQHPSQASQASAVLTKELTPLSPPACSFHLPPLWLQSPPCPEVCFLETNQVVGPKQ